MKYINANALLLCLNLAVISLLNVSYAGIISYKIDAYGNVLESSENLRYYYNTYTTKYYKQWVFDSLNNTVTNTRYGTVARALNTSLFTVADIIDVRYGLYNSAYLKTTVGNYRLYYNGSVRKVTDNINTYHGVYGYNLSGYWQFDVVNNKFRNTRYGSYYRTLNTDLFSVADILDLTYTYGSWAYVNTAVGKFRISSYGSVYSLPDNLTYYNAVYGSAYRYSYPYYSRKWVFDAESNKLGLNSASRTLNTDLFTVADITDMTYSLGNTAWVTVNMNEEEKEKEVQVSSPKTNSIFFLTFIVMLGRHIQRSLKHSIN